MLGLCLRRTVQETRALTNDALPEVVGLALGGPVPRELPVNLVLNVRHRNECGYDTVPVASLDYHKPRQRI